MLKELASCNGDISKESFVRGYYVYKEHWEAAVGDELECQQERRNGADAYAVAVVHEGTVVGHVPRRISRICSLFIRRGGVICCCVTDRRRHSSDLPQGGLEIPCLLSFEGEAKDIKKLVTLLNGNTC